MVEGEVQFRRPEAADIDALLRLQAGYYREDGYAHDKGMARQAWQTFLSDTSLGAYGQLIPQQDSSDTSLLRSGTALSTLGLMRSLTSYISFRRCAVRGSDARPSVLQKPHASSLG